MSALDPSGPAPEARAPAFLWLLFGACAAPLAWLGQLMLGYGVSAQVCYPGDHPVALASAGSLFAAMVAMDIIALAACIAGATVSWRAWQNLRQGQDRNRFLALWGMMSSLWFLAAVLFNTIASVMVPSCPG
jgi:hypothetical protein